MSFRNDLFLLALSDKIFIAFKMWDYEVTMNHICVMNNDSNL